MAGEGLGLSITDDQQSLPIFTGIILFMCLVAVSKVSSKVYATDVRVVACRVSQLHYRGPFL